MHAVREARAVAETEKVDELLATATSAVREAENGPAVIARIEDALGQPLQVLGGDTEARFTFLAVRRWFGWAAGQILLFDIGGGSLEIAAGADELPEAAASVPLGARPDDARFLPDDPPGETAVERCACTRSATLAPVATRSALSRGPTTSWDRPRRSGHSRSSWDIRRRAGPASSGCCSRGPRSARGFPGWRASPHPLVRSCPASRPDRTFQIVAAAVVLHAAMQVLDVDELEVCPWALREGVLLRYIESLSWSAAPA